MQLPGYVQFCIDRLENAGFAAYAVGGCVRDALLGRIPHDYDLCTAATPADTARLFADFPQVHAGEKHGTIGVIFEKEVCEITTFRTEGDYTDSRHPQWVSFVTDIEQDLARRDFTINAMAYSPTRGYCDPFGGQKDLQNHILRAVGDPEQRFTEDALRILRGVRFAARFHLTPEPETERAMLALAPRLHNIAAERIFDELCHFLPVATVEDLLRYAPILSEVIPALKPCLGFDQRNRHHLYDIFTHTAHVVEGVPADLTLRWAALLHDVGKPATFTLDENGQGHFYGHAEKSAQMADAILRQLKAPTQLREDVAFLVEKHMTPLPPDKKILRRRLSQYGQTKLTWLLQLQKMDFCAKGVLGDAGDFDAIEAILSEILADNACLHLKDLAVNGHDLMGLGYRGPEIGKNLQLLLEQVLDDQVPNDKEALLHYLQARRTS